MIKPCRRLTRFLVAATLLSVSAMASAQWQLDAEQSSVNFISVKNNRVAEVHHFGSLTGHIDSAAKVELAIDLASVETAVPTRNQRMRELLFEAAAFPSARVEAQLDQSMLADLAAGGRVSLDLPIKLSLHGIDFTWSVPVLAWGEGHEQLLVVTRQPVIIRAGDFGLTAGVDALREIAHLDAISYAVPVTCNLVFKRAD